ncbi:MAG: DinB family protein [Acidimicrobiia bacterium]|nr:DinB family protein [Acidimicrobiia bacterium]
MTFIDEHGRTHPPLAANELDTLMGFLDYQRATLAWKCRGLDSHGMESSVGASTMTLGGLLKHLALVEDSWSARWLHGMDRQPPWDSIDWAADPDWDWDSAAEDSPEELLAIWERSVNRSRELYERALSDGDLSQLAKRPFEDGSAPSLRWILVHMIEEYARHNGHADLLRESVDGQTGE